MIYKPRSDSIFGRGASSVCLATLLVLVLASPAATQTQTDANVLLQSGRQQFQEARKAGTDEAYQKAEATFTQALQLEPKSIEALTYRGLVKFERSGLLAKQGHFDASGALTNEAVADLDRAVSLDPNDYQARLMRGLSYAQFPSFLNKGTTAIEDLEVVTKHSQFASQSAAARARVQLTLGRAYAAAGQTEKAGESFGAAIAVAPQSPDGIMAKQELEKLAATPVAKDSQGRRRPDHFPQISDETSPIIVAATVTLPAGVNISGRASLQPSLQKFLGQLEKQPGLLGMHMLMSMDQPRMLVIMSWWKDKKALNDWFYSDTHQGIISEYYSSGPPRPQSNGKPGPSMKDSGQIGMELFTSLPGSVRYGGGLVPDSIQKKTADPRPN